MPRGKSIRAQVLMVPFVALFGFLSVIVIVVIGLGIQEENSKKTLDNLVLLDRIREIERHMSAARNIEKDFLIEPKFQYVLQHRQVLREFSKDLDWLTKQRISLQLQAKAKIWETQVKDYEHSFLDMESELAEIGYTENTALKGEISLSATVIENWLTGDNPRKIFFKLRDLEHRYTLEADPLTLKKWNGTLARLETVISASGYDRETREILKTATSQYAQAFTRFADLNDDLKKDRKQVNSKSLMLSQDFANELERFNGMTTDTALSGLERFQKFAIYILAVTFVIGVLVFFVSRRISAQISEPLTDVSETMVRLADGELDAPIPDGIYQKEINLVVDAVRSFRDASLERRAARFQLSEANKQTQNIIRSMREALFETDSKGCIRMANPAAENLLDLSASEIVGKKLQQFFGHSHSLSSTEKLGAIRSVLDIACRSSEDCSIILNQSELPIFMVQSDGFIVSVNRCASELTGYGPNELIFKNIETLISETDCSPGEGHPGSDFVSMGNGKVISVIGKNGALSEVSFAVTPLGLQEDLEFLCVMYQKNPEATIEEDQEALQSQLLKDFGFDTDLEVWANAQHDSRDVSRWVVNSEGQNIPVDYTGALLRGADRSVTGAIFVVRDITTQITAERELNQFKSTLDRVSAEIYMFDPESLKFFYANRAAIESSGVEYPDLIDLTPMDMTPDLDEERFRGRLQPLIDGTQNSIRYETEKTSTTGEQVFEEVFIQLIHLDGQLPRFIAFVTDISTRRNAELLLDRFKSTLDSTSGAVFMFKPDSLEFVFLNEEAKFQTGWSEDEYVLRTPEDINPVFSRERFRMLTASLIYGTQRSVMLTTTGLNGKPAEIIVELFHPDKSDPWFTVTVRDISQRLEAEREIRSFKKTLDQSQDEIYMLDQDTLELTYMNNMAKDICEVGKEGYSGLTLMDLNHNFSKSIFLERTKELLEGRKKQIVYQSINKANRPVEVSLQMVVSGENRKRFVLIASDISERLAADKEKSQFISTVSHELRTPLTSIKGVLGIISAGAVGKVDTKIDDLISMALKNSNRLERLIDDILDTEKIEAGQMDYFFEPVDLSELIGEALQANEGYAEAHKVKFIAKGVDRPAVISGDADRLMQVLANLMSNAAKFSNEGDEIEVSLALSADKVRLAVKDQGCGIPKSAQPTIFDKFTQADSSDQRGKGGTGLGLSIVKMMVEAHGGTIDFTSKTGKGSEFFIDFDLLAPKSKVA